VGAVSFVACIAVSCTTERVITPQPRQEAIHFDSMLVAAEFAADTVRIEALYAATIPLAFGVVPESLTVVEDGRLVTMAAVSYEIVYVDPLGNPTDTVLSFAAWRGPNADEIFVSASEQLLKQTLVVYANGRTEEVRTAIGSVKNHFVQVDPGTCSALDLGSISGDALFTNCRPSRQSAALDVNIAPYGVHNGSATVRNLVVGSTTLHAIQLMEKP
jgi:hypothetical protein